MNAKARTYVATIILSATLLLMLQDWHPLWHLSRQDFAGVIALIGLAIISELLYVSAMVGAHTALASIAFIPLFACILLFPPSAAFAAAIVTSLSTQLLVHKRPLIRGAFNAAQIAASLVIANAVYEAFGGRHASPLRLELNTVSGVAAFFGLAITFFFLNQAFVSVVIALSSGERISTIFNRMVAPAGSGLLFDVFASPLAIVVALLYSSFSSGGLLMGVLPLLIIRHSYSQNVALQRANKDLLAVLVKTIETRDPYTSGHSIRVSILARAIAEDMGLSAGKVERIETAAIVHDIGKVDAVYASIIRKEGSLTDAERKVIVTHAAKGAEFLKTLTSFPEDVIAGVRHHHERFDGTGYPDGMQGESSPLAARIIMLCDSIDAMLSDRPYRKALSVDHVRSELLRCAGTQFDPRIVEVILKKNTIERAAALVRPDSLAHRTLLAVSA